MTHEAHGHLGEVAQLADAVCHVGAEAVALLGNGGVEHHVGVAQVLLAAAHAELELVAREGEGAGAVAIGVVAQHVG